LANNRVAGAVTTGILAVVSAVLHGSQIAIEATCLSWRRNSHELKEPAIAGTFALCSCGPALKR